MSALANIVINDGASTPVAHTFIPVSNNVPLTVFRTNKAATPLVGQETLKISIHDQSSKGNGLSRVKLTLHLPSLEQTSGGTSTGYVAPPKVAYHNKVDVDFILPSRGTHQERRDILTLLKNALANAIIVDAIENLNSPY